MHNNIIRLNHSAYFSPNFSEREREVLSSLPQAKYFSKLPDPTQLIGGRNIFISNSNTDFSRLPKDLLENSALILHPNSGYDNFSPEFVEKSRGSIILGNTIRAQAVATTTLAVIFEQLSAVPHQPIWEKGRQFPRTLLRQLNILIVGYGHIGKILQQVLAPICQSIEVEDPYQGMIPDKDDDHYDIIILACSLNKKNHHYINQEKLSRLKETVMILNPARGNLIDQQALFEFLQSNPRAFAYLDVFNQEPHQLDADQLPKNIKISSHIAGVYRQLEEQMIKFEWAVIDDYLKDNEIEFKQKYRSKNLHQRLHQGMLI